MTVFPASIDNVFTITDALSGTAAVDVSILFSGIELSGLVAIYSAVWLYALGPRVLKQKMAQYCYNETHSLTYLLTYLLHGAESFLRK